LFYPVNAYFFSPNIAIYDAAAFRFNAQTVSQSPSTSTTDVSGVLVPTVQTFDLYNFILSQFCASYPIDVNSVPPQIKILLYRECAQVRSLALVRGHTIALSWGQVLSFYIDQGYIVSTGMSTEQVVLPLQIVYNNTSAILNGFQTRVIFQYNVTVQGYYFTTPS